MAAIIGHCPELVSSGCPVVGQYLFDVLFGWDSREDILQPSPRVDVGSLAAREEIVDDGGSHGCVMIAAEEIVLASKLQRPAGSFCGEGVRQVGTAVQRD